MTARGTMRLYLGASVRSATPGVSSPKTAVRPSRSSGNRSPNGTGPVMAARCRDFNGGSAYGSLRVTAPPDIEPSVEPTEG